MKYTIKYAKYQTYTIGTGYKYKLTWQFAGMLFILLSLVFCLGIVAFIAFVNYKLFPLIFVSGLTISVSYAAIAGTKSPTGDRFRAFPYKKETWKTKTVMATGMYTTVMLLERLLEHDYLANFWNPDEIVEEVLNINTLLMNGQLDTEAVEQYNKSLGLLLTECEKASQHQLLGGKEYDTSLKSALDVASRVNQDLT